MVAGIHDQQTLLGFQTRHHCTRASNRVTDGINGRVPVDSTAIDAGLDPVSEADGNFEEFEERANHARSSGGRGRP